MYRLVMLPLLVVLINVVPTAEAQQMRDVTVTVDPAVTYQVIEGFGTCYIDWGDDWRPEYRDPAFLDTVVNDLGMSIVRQQMQDELEPVDDGAPGEFNWDGFKVGDVGSGWSFTDRQRFLEEFKKRGVTRFVMSPWTPPSFTKTHNAGRFGGHLRMDKVEEYAEYMAASVILAKKNHGIDIGYVTVQNEPLFIEPYHSCVYNGYTIREAVRALMRRFEKEGIKTKILTGEDMMFASRMLNYVRPTMADPETRDFPGGFCTHRQGEFAEVRKWHNATKQWGRQNWMTETSGHQQTWDGALKMAVDMYDYLVGGNFNAWIYWQITDSESSGEYALMVDGKRTPKYHAAKHFYRYVRPGALRVDGASADKDVLVSAFRHDVEGTLTVVLINRADAPARVTLDVAGDRKPGQYAVMLSTQGKGCEQVGSSDGTRAVELPPKSIVTLYGMADGLKTRDKIEEWPEAWVDPSPGEKWGDLTDNPPVKAPDRTFTPLHAAILAGRMSEVDKLLNDHADVNAPALDGWTPLHMAAATFGSEAGSDGKRVSKYDVFKRVMEAKPDLNVVTTDGWTPLHAAVANAHTAWQHEPAEVTNRVRGLIVAGCDANAGDANGRTPLHWAAWQGHSILDQPPTPEVVNVLLEHKPSINVTDKIGRTALHYAAEMGHLNIVKALVNAGADPTIADAAGKTPAELAGARELADVVAAIVKGPQTGGRLVVDPPVPQVKATTSGKLGRELLRAAWDGDEARVRELLAQGADANYTDTDGFRPVDRARDNGHVRIVEMLRQAERE